MKKQLSFRRCALFFMALIFCGFTALLLFDVELLAKTDSRGMDRLFGIVGVIKVPPAKDPVRINLKDMNGNNISLSDFKGKIVFLNFWTTWCPTCRIEMPSMEKLHQKLKNKDFAMVTINLQESASQVKTFFKEFKLTFTALLDSTGEVGASCRIASKTAAFSGLALWLGTLVKSGSGWAWGAKTSTSVNPAASRAGHTADVPTPCSGERWPRSAW